MFTLTRRHFQGAVSMPFQLQKTPYTNYFKPRDRIPNKRFEQIVKMPEYRDSIKQQENRNFAGCKLSLENLLAKLASEDGKESLAYVHVLSRLAYTTLKGLQFEESEQMFKECIDLVPKATDNLSNLYSA